MEPISSVAAAFGKMTSGLFIVTAAEGSNREGYLASWIQQTSFSPLMLSLAMKPGRPCYDQIKTHGKFCVNIVGQNNGGLMKPFWSPKEGVDPFTGLDILVSPRGNLILNSAMAALECEFRSSVSPGDHEIMFAEVVDGRILQPEDKPLAHTRKSGLSY